MSRKKGSYDNSVTGEKANISRMGIKKLTSGKAMGKSKDNGFTEREHFEAVSRVGELYKKASFIASEPDRHGNQDVSCVKKYDVSCKLRSGKKATAHITVKEYKNGENKIYSLELMKR